MIGGVMLSKIRLNNCLEIRRNENPGFNPAELARQWTFPNPKFYENARLGFSNYGTPESLCLATFTNEALFLLRGAAADIIRQYPQVEIVDETFSLPQAFEPSSIILRDYQKDALQSLLLKNQGVIVSPPGSGKTVLLIELLIQRAQKTLILVHTKDLLEQWRNRLMTFTKINPGIVSGGVYDVQPVTIATVQSLNRPLPDDFKNSFGMVILDECHHCPASTFRKIVDQFPARFRYGATATPERPDGMSFLLGAVMGAVIHTVENDCLLATGDIIKPVIKPIETAAYYPMVESYGELLAKIAKDEQRNALIVDFIGKEAKAGNFCLILSERVSHVKRLHELFKTEYPEMKSFCITGQDTKEHRQNAIDAMNQGAANVLFSTKLADEGLDIRRLNRLFLTCPVRAINKVTQQIGRIQRTFPEKKDAIVFDFVDNNSLAKSQYYSRKKKLYEKHNMRITDENRDDEKSLFGYCSIL